MMEQSACLSGCHPWRRHILPSPRFCFFEDPGCLHPQRQTRSQLFLRCCFLQVASALWCSLGVAAPTGRTDPARSLVSARAPIYFTMRRQRLSVGCPGCVFSRAVVCPCWGSICSILWSVTRCLAVHRHQIGEQTRTWGPVPWQARKLLEKGEWNLNRALKRDESHRKEDIRAGMWP